MLFGLVVGYNFIIPLIEMLTRYILLLLACYRGLRFRAELLTSSCSGTPIFSTV